MRCIIAYFANYSVIIQVVVVSLSFLVYLTFAETGTEGPTSSHTTSPPNGIKTAVFAYLRDIDLFVLFSHLLANKKIRI